MEYAKVFMTGRSQAVRIPRSFRFSAKVLRIQREGERVILTPVKSNVWDEFFEQYACPEFALDRSAAQQMQSRELFR